MPATKSTKTTISCPFCGTNDENTLNLDLVRLDVVCCAGCDAEYTVSEAVTRATETLSAWEQVAEMVAFGRKLMES